MAKDNQYYIDQYKDNDTIIETYFKDDNNDDIDSIITPIKIDNRQLVSMPDNQYDSSHCSGFAVANLFESLYWKKTGKLKNLNASQIYAKAKELDGRPYENGVHLIYAIQAAAKLCGESDNCKYDRIKLNGSNTISIIKRYIHKYNFLLTSLIIHEGWTKCNKDNYTIRASNKILGAHSVVICGYDDFGLYIQNSWGTNWGYKGFGVIPWDDFLHNVQYVWYISL